MENFQEREEKNIQNLNILLLIQINAIKMLQIKKQNVISFLKIIQISKKIIILKNI